MIEETTKLENFQKSLNGDGDNDDGDDDDDEDGHDFTVIDTSKLNENEIVLNNSVLITNGYYHDDRKRAKRDVKQNKNKLVYNNNYHETKIITESEESIQGLKIQIQKEFIHFEETKKCVEKIFEFYEEDIEIRIISLEAEIDKQRDLMFVKMDSLKKIIKHKPFTLKKLRKIETSIRNLETQILKYKHDNQMFNKMSFNVGKTELTIQNVGELNSPFSSNYDRIKASNSVNIPFELVVCLTYFEEIKRIIITDFNDRSFKILDLNGNYLGSYNPDQLLERPGPVCVSNSAKEIYIQDHAYEKIFVFDTNFKFLRDFGDERCQTPFGSTIDETTSRIYLSAYLNNLITMWDTKTGNFVAEIEIFSPTFMNIFRSKLFVMSATESEIFTTEATLEATINNQNSIFIFNKYNYEILNKIQIKNCIHPKGLHIDDCMTIYLTAYDISLNESMKEAKASEVSNVRVQSTSTPNENSTETTTANENGGEQGQTQNQSNSFNTNDRTRCLYKLSENGEIIGKTNLSLSGIFSMVIVDKKLYAIRGYRTPPVYMIEFE